MSLSRRAFFRRASSTSSVGSTLPSGEAGASERLPVTTAQIAAAAQAASRRTAEDLAADELYWRDIQQAFAIDRTLLNLNNGGCSPSPRVVHQALEGALDRSVTSPSYYERDILGPGIESVRRELARELGCDAEELALTRNASEALQIVQLGIELRAGDEVLTTNQDYGRMLDTWDQRARRDQIRVNKISFPVPISNPEDLVPRFTRAITSRTRVLHVCHMTARTGQIFPVRQLCDLARRRGIQTIVDGAHGFAQLPFTIDEIGCDYYATSLHKWLQAPVGTGFLYVRKDRIADIWPMHPGPARLRQDIRKFEQVGAREMAYHVAVAEALAFHRAIGIEPKSARLRYLRNRWMDRLAKIPRVRLLTSANPAASCGVASFAVSGLEPEQIETALWDEHRIIVLPIWHREYRGTRVTPGVYTTAAEIDRFSDAIEELIKRPAARVPKAGIRRETGV